MLEMFVFISGYVWSFSIFEKNKVQSIIELTKNKFKRLIIPSLLFSAVYLLLLTNWQSQSLLSILYDLLNGVGHMWFLPMLFWCFIISAFLNKINVSDRLKIGSLFIISLISIIPLPLRLSSSLYYLFFFYAGFLCRKYIAKLDLNISIRHIVISWIVFIIAFVGLTIVSKNDLIPFPDYGLITKAITAVINKLFRVVFSSLGIIAMLITAIYITNTNKLPQWIVEVGNYCFGVYLFQQFILMILYYHTSLPIVVTPHLLPWIGTLVALGLSLLFSWLLRKTRIGRQLI